MIKNSPGSTFKHQNHLVLFWCSKSNLFWKKKSYISPGWANPSAPNQTLIPPWTLWFILWGHSSPERLQPRWSSKIVQDRWPGSIPVGFCWKTKYQLSAKNGGFSNWLSLPEGKSSRFLKFFEVWLLATNPNNAISPILGKLYLWKTCFSLCACWSVQDTFTCRKIKTYTALGPQSLDVTLKKDEMWIQPREWCYIYIHDLYIH